MLYFLLNGNELEFCIIIVGLQERGIWDHESKDRYQEQDAKGKLIRMKDLAKFKLIPVDK